MNNFKSSYKKLNRSINTWCKYTKRIDTYGLGCLHNCHYCYAKSLLEFRNKWNIPVESDLIDIKIAISKLNKGDIVRIGSMTDCFQPIELNKKITYKTIELLNHYGIHYLIVTKSGLVSDDEYIAVYDKNLAHFQISISNTDFNYSKNYENCSSLQSRIDSIEKLNNLGFDVSIRLSPFIYENFDYSVINSIKCNKILIEFLKVNHWTIKNFKVKYDDYKLKFGGHLNLELNKKIELISKIVKPEISVGEYVLKHHEYFSENVNFNKKDCCNLNYKSNEFKQLKLFQ